MDSHLLGAQHYLVQIEMLPRRSRWGSDKHVTEVGARYAARGHLSAASDKLDFHATTELKSSASVQKM